MCCDRMGHRNTGLSRIVRIHRAAQPRRLPSAVPPAEAKSLKAPLWIVQSPSTVMCTECIIGLTVYEAKRTFFGNLPSRPTILSSRTSCLSWRRSARMPPTISKIISQAISPRWEACIVAKVDYEREVRTPDICRKAPLRIVTTPSSTVLCSACIIGLNVYGAKRPCIGNLPSRRTIQSSKKLA